MKNNGQAKIAVIFFIVMLFTFAIWIGVGKNNQKSNFEIQCVSNGGTIQYAGQWPDNAVVCTTKK